MKFLHNDGTYRDYRPALNETPVAGSAHYASKVIEFNGVVQPNSTGKCVASFPGIYGNQWDFLCKVGTKGMPGYGPKDLLSTACVFLPETHPSFGKHVPNTEEGEECYCHALYGGKVKWGCKWFHHWKTNVEEAIKLNQTMCIVCWQQDEIDDLDSQEPTQAEKLATMRYGGRYVDGGDSQLDKRELVEWPPRGKVGIGLGASQTGEVAYLKKLGCKLELTTVHNFPHKIGTFLKSWN